MPRQRTWSELSTRQQRTIIGAAVAQVTLQAAALVDLVRRPRARVKGDKRVWAAASFVNFAGPLAYFAFGRRR